MSDAQGKENRKMIEVKFAKKQLWGLHKINSSGMSINEAKVHKSGLVKNNKIYVVGKFGDPLAIWRELPAISISLVVVEVPHKNGGASSCENVKEIMVEDIIIINQ